MRARVAVEHDEQGRLNAGVVGNAEQKGFVPTGARIGERDLKHAPARRLRAVRCRERVAEVAAERDVGVVFVPENLSVRPSDQLGIALIPLLEGNG